jgi:predicted kinase
VCTADEATVRARLARREGDASDADFDVYVRAREEWEPLGEALAGVATEVDTGAPAPETAARARAALRVAGLVE